MFLHPLSNLLSVELNLISRIKNDITFQILIEVFPPVTDRLSAVRVIHKEIFVSRVVRDE